MRRLSPAGESSSSGEKGQHIPVVVIGALDDGDMAGIRIADQLCTANMLGQIPAILYWYQRVHLAMYDVLSECLLPCLALIDH